ncbi:MAG: TatD family hydrolase [Gemmatimonadaceae bacterium]|nr:TatD family hydrolase [Chitinophagaceae bacterium]
MIMIDTHCHLYVEEFDADRGAMMTRAENEGVTNFFLPAIDKKAMPRLLEMEAGFAKRCHAMAGLHPCSVKADFEAELQFVEECLKKRRFAAVGEIGLDFYWDKTFVAQQYNAFERQISLALEYELPIVIHCRDAMKECIETVSKYSKRGLRGIFHCFGGSIEQAEEIVARGFYLGIGGVVTFKKSGLDQVIAKIGLDSLVLETDAPYLSPVPFRGKRNESAYLKYISEAIAAATGTTKDEVAAITTRNAKNVFGPQYFP